MPKGVIGVVCQEASRYSEFWADLVNAGLSGVQVMTAIDGPLGQSRNRMVSAFLQSEASWLLFVDDDHALAPGWVKGFVARAEQANVPILGSVYTTRRPPFQPTLYGPPDANMVFASKVLTDFPTSGIFPVYACGGSGLLVQRHVFETMPAAWFELGYSDNLGEDLWFCHKAQQLGFPVHVDLESRLGHFMPWAAWPAVVNGQWVTSIRRHGLELNMAPATRETWEPVLA